MKDASASAKFDRWMWWPTACTVAMTAMFVFVGDLPGPLNIVLVVWALVAGPAVALLLIWLTCVLALRRRQRRAASTLLAVAVPALLLVPMELVADYVHLGLMLTFGIGIIGPMPPAGLPVAVYDWSTGFAGTNNTFLIHDITDAIAQPLTNGVPQAWRGNGWFGECAGKVQHLIGHYYICND